MGAEDFVKLSVNCRADFAMTDLSEKAELAFYRGLVYCGLNSTGGVIPRRDLVHLGPARVADELVAKGYWQATKVGWSFRAWDKWQGDFEQIAEKRRRDAERKRDKRRQEREQRFYDNDEGAA